MPSGGRIGFNRKDHIGQGQRSRYLDQAVNMVLHAANGMNKKFLMFAYACDVRPHAGLEFFRNHSLAFAGAEYNMDYILDVCVRHCAAPPALIIYGDAIFPALTDWANFF